MSRRIVVNRPAIRIEQRTESQTLELGTDISGPACIYAHVRVRQGTVTYLRGSERVEAPVTYELFLPPFTIAQAWLERCDVMSSGLAFPPEYATELPGEPVLWHAASDRPPASLAEVLDRLRQRRAERSVARQPQPAAPAAAAKSLLDREYGGRMPIASIAARAGLAPAALSRAFRESYGIPPVKYRHHVRIMDALLQLASGSAPVDASLDAGFEDLSRFYKVFRKVACGAPGSYRAGPSKNAKT